MTLISYSASRGAWRQWLSACVAAAISMGSSASTTTVYSEDFAGCTTGGFLFTSGSLWHATSLTGCAPSHPGCGLYFGQDATCTFATPLAVSGNADSPTIDLTGVVAPITLRFDYRVGNEGSGCTWDLATVLLSDDGFGSSTVVADLNCGAPTALLENAGWQSATVDLSAWAGSIVQLRFGFDSVDNIANGYFGFAVAGIEVEGTVAEPKLTLEGGACGNDAFPSEPGHQLAISLWMRDVVAPGASGFQAFVEFDDAALVYRDDLSSYTAGPFPLHILNFGAPSPFNVEWAPGRLRLDGSSAPLNPTATGNTPLATLVFDVLDECGTTALGFGGYPAVPAFFSELSRFGSPIATIAPPTGSLALDDTSPEITCPPSVTVAADVTVPLCVGSNCCTAHGTAGCSDADCTTAVCAIDAFCCTVHWDSDCADEAVDHCGPVQSPCLGATVSFNVTASDACDPTPNVLCTPTSGSFFPIGTTTVHCTATDACGNVDTCSFTVTVKPTNLALVDVKLVVGSATAPSATRCIRFQTDACSAVVTESVLFTSDGLGGQVSGPIVLELPCGDWSSLCVKDEQHSLRQTVALTNAGNSWVAAPQVVLLPGDDDNDGDVDINDVTWLVFTFGTTAVGDPCPFVFPGPGPRDADFSLNGVVSTEDYSLMTDQFLTLSSCTCTLPSEGQPDPANPPHVDHRRSLPISEVDPRIRSHVDRNHDGIFDADDVELFEVERGLPNVLSTRLRVEPAQRHPATKGTRR